MKIELSALGPILKEKSEATNKLMDQLVKEQAQAMEVRQVVEADESIAKVSTFIGNTCSICKQVSFTLT